MKGFVCSVCGFISIDGRAPENCPVCGAARTSFQEKEEAINTPQDPANMTELEKKHTPGRVIVKECGLISECCQDAHAKIGEIQHPMLAEHYIVWLDFYLDKKFIGRVKLTPEHLNPAAGLHIKAESGTLTVIEFCNMHGSWIKETDL